MKVDHETLKSKLTRGDITRVAEETGLSKPTVCDHLYGRVKHPSQLIIREALRIIRRREKQIEQINKEIHN